MKKLLFVDDDPRVLEALQQGLRSQESQWEIAFAPGGEAALAFLEASPFDVIISDMRMPGMDGAELLKRVRDRHPDMLRIVCATPAELDATLRAVPFAHQFLVKPCELDALRVAIGRAGSLFEVLNHDLLARIVGPTQGLPSLPRVYSALQDAVADPNVSLDKVARIVEQDIAISAKTLQLVNSALFALRRNITSVRTAVSYIGITVLKQLILSAEVFRVFKDSDAVDGFSLEDLYAHSQLTARIAGAMNAAQYVPEAPVVASLLHDVGKLVLATRLPNQFAAILKQAQEQERPLHEVEQEVLGLSHAEIGAGLLGLWGLPCVIVEAVAHHHNPTRVPHEKLDTIGAVYIANCLAAKHPIRSGDGMIHSPMDMEYVTEIGAAKYLPEWEALAKSAAQELAAASIGG